MQDDVALTENDEGKAVINTGGGQIGRVMNVEHGKAHVDPDPGLTDRIRTELGWNDEHDEENYVLDAASIESVSDDEIRLGR